MAQDVLEVLRNMSEQQLTRQVIIPLARAMFKDGKIEEVHGSLELGRDIICTGKHPLLNRAYILCIQVKNHRIDYGATAGPYSVVSLANQVQQARETGVVLESGDTIQPHEIWLLTTYPFAEGTRRAARESLQRIARASGTIVDGADLEALLRHHCPELIQELESITDSRLSRTIAWLSAHHESKAFGLRLDRAIQDFHVKSRVFPTGALSSALLAGALALDDITEVIGTEIPSSQVSAAVGGGTGFVAEDLRSRPELMRIKPVVERYSVPVTWSAQFDDILEEDLETETDDGDSRPDDKQPPVTIDREYCIQLSSWAKAQRCLLKDTIQKLPDELSPSNCAVVTDILETVRMSEAGLAELIAALEDMDCITMSDKFHQDQTQIKIPDETLLLQIAPQVLVQGAPGAGKTTFARRLAVSLLRRGQKVLYLRCSAIPSEMKDAAMLEIARASAAPGTPQSWSMRDSVVVVDGLDESPFDLSPQLGILARKAGQRVVATARAAYPTELRQVLPTIELAGFTREDRDYFFEQWFKSDARGLQAASDLVKQYPDIESHTRLPLLATLVAALIENNYSPTTRAEIYAQRLDLLLERWEAVKGLKRLSVPKRSQLRFLMFLAFDVHSRVEKSSVFGWEQLRKAFADGLGHYGDKLDPEDFVNKLVSVSGVLQTDGIHFSFGHLSFQEHLAGWYLAERSRLHDVYDLLGDNWWSEPLKFYANIRQEITDLIELCEECETTPMYRAQLRELVKHAPHTGSVAVDILEATPTDKI